MQKTNIGLLPPLYIKRKLAQLVEYHHDKALTRKYQNTLHHFLYLLDEENYLKS